MFKNIQIVGNVGKDPEIKHLPGGAIAASFGVACNEQWIGSDGEPVKKVTWFNVVAYQTGEKGLVTSLIQPWLKGGQLVFISGDPTLRAWTAQDGTERRSFEIKLGPQSTIRMLGRRNGDTANGHDEAKGEAVADTSDLPADKEKIPF